jgi:hypothetical protein
MTLLQRLILSHEVASLGPVEATGITKFPHWVPVVAIYKQRNRDASGSWINIVGAPRG